MEAYQKKKYDIISGVDEVGRGCISGPVFAAAVVFQKEFSHHLLRDSKKLSEAQRYIIKDLLDRNQVLYGIGVATVKEVEKINVLNASILAMHRALDDLPMTPTQILVDGNKFHPYRGIPHRCIIGGDRESPVISAASIFAKIYRDQYMKRMALEYPKYHWEQNKGYPTLAHRKALLEFGATPHHRKTFRTLKISQKSLF